MTDSLDEALEARLHHFLRGVAASRTMHTPARQEKFLEVCMQETIRDIRRLCQDAHEGTVGPAKFKAKRRHLGLLNGEGQPVTGAEGDYRVGDVHRPDLRMVES